MVDPFLFFGLTSKISFAARIAAVCFTSSSSNSSESELSEEDESSNKNNAHGSICKRNGEEVRSLAAENPRLRGVGVSSIPWQRRDVHGESAADSGRCVGDAGALASGTDAARLREYLCWAESEGTTHSDLDLR
jgi:hypothetical protein